MNVAANVRFFLAVHDQWHIFAVDFVADQPIDDMDAGFLQFSAPLNVVGPRRIERRNSTTTVICLSLLWQPLHINAPSIRVSPPVR